MLSLEEQLVGNWELPVLAHRNETHRLVVAVVAPIGNSVSTSARGKQRTADWKVKVAERMKNLRGASAFDPAWPLALTVGFSFCPGLHGNQRLDIENFLKPTLDAVAAGLFCDRLLEPAEIVRYNFDDSNFRYLLVQRLTDSSNNESEGAALVVSAVDERSLEQPPD